MRDHTPARAESILLDRILQWTRDEPRVRAALLTSSRASDVAPVDALSDYDIALVVEDPDALRRDLGWLEDIGTVLVRQVPEPSPWADAMQTVLVFFAGGHAGATKVDFALLPVAEFARHRRAGTLPENLDVGWKLLLDKDGVTDGLASPAYAAHRVRKPSADAFAWLVESFFFEATYVAKNLWRDEVWPAKHSLEAVMKQEMLRRMLEWLVASERGWDYRPGKLGRGLDEDVPDHLWSEFVTTFVGFDRDATWRALFGTLEVFRTAATMVAARLGFAYPAHVDDDVTAYLRNLRELG